MGHFHSSPQLHINKHFPLQYVQHFDIDFYSGPTQVKVLPLSTVLSLKKCGKYECAFEAMMTDKSIRDISKITCNKRAHIFFFCMLSSVSQISHWVFQHFDYTKYSGSIENAKGSLCSL